MSVQSRLAIATRGFRGGGGQFIAGTIIAAEDLVIELQPDTEAEVIEIIEAEVETQEATAEVVEIVEAEVD